MEERKMNDVLDKVKDMDLAVNKIVVPLLQDTIADGNRHGKRLFVLILIELFIILAVSISALILVYNQNIKYQEFLSQFEFGEETVYQDLDTNAGGDITNSSITNN